MRSLKANMNMARYSVLLLVLLFALAPCAVKQNIADAAGLSYTKAAHKTRTTLSVHSCPGADYFVKEAPVHATLKAFEIPHYNTQLRTDYTGQYRRYASKAYQNRYLFGQNYPPRYILFKRLKLDADTSLTVSLFA